MLEFRFDTQLLIEGHDLDEDAIHDYILANIAGYCAGLGDIHDIVIENMERQENGLHG